jgi:GNAT superfamily N-acetyltransferase
MPPQQADVVEVTDRHRDGAIDLLERFFREEGFSTPAHLIVGNLDQMLADDTCWVAAVMQDGLLRGIVTVTTMLYVEWGRLGEIGDLYVLPGSRNRGLARRLVDAAIDWGRRRGCSGMYVTIAADGEAQQRLLQFYKQLNFEPTGRTTMMWSGLTERSLSQ